MALARRTATANKAAALNDALVRVKATAGGLTTHIAAALAPAVTKAADRLAEIAGNAIEFIRANQGIVVNVAAAAVGLGAAGTAPVALGGAIFAASFAFSGWAKAIGLATGGLRRLSGVASHKQHRDPLCGFPYTGRPSPARCRHAGSGRPQASLPRCKPPWPAYSRSRPAGFRTPGLACRPGYAGR
jgi:hypothetical protein